MELELVALWLQLAAAAAIILVASSRLARSADVIAEKTGLGRSFVGVVLLATATSLPELGTGVGAIAIVGAPDLAAGDAFGSNLVNLLIIALADIYWRRGPVLARFTMTAAVVGVLGIAVISVTAIAMLVHASTSWFAGWHVSPFTIVLAVCFVGAMYLIYRIDRSGTDAGGSPDQYASASLSRAVAVYTVAASVIIAAAVWLARTGEGITHAMGWDASFVGTQFLAVSTSLPELATSFAALRIGAPELAIGNLLGSNLFNVGFVLTVDDLVLVGAPLWSAIAPVHAVTAVFAILMTTVVVIALTVRRTAPRKRLLTPESGALLALYAAASVMVFALG